MAAGAGSHQFLVITPGDAADMTEMDDATRRELAGTLLDGYVHGPAAGTQATARALAKAAAARTVELIQVRISSAPARVPEPTASLMSRVKKFLRL